MVLSEIPKDSFVSYLFQAKLGLEVRDGVMYLVRRRYGLRGPGTKGEPSIPGIIIIKKHTRDGQVRANGTNLVLHVCLSLMRCYT